MAGLPQVGVQLIAQGAKAFTGDMNAGAVSVKVFVNATQEGSKGVSAFGQIAIGALRAVGQAAVQAGAEAAKAIGAFVSDAISQAGDFESGMLRFGSITGLKEGSKDLEDFSALFLKLGADTQFSAAQAEEAAINLAKGGLTPAQIAGGALADTLTLAAAGELDLATAADITAKQLGVWADQGVTSAQVADLLAQSANASVVSVEELALGMANVGGVAKLAGASFQDTVTALGAVSAGFSSAADAGTSMKAFLMRLQPTTKPAIAAMKELGLYTKEGGSAFYDAQGNFVGFSKAADLLQGSLKGMSKAQQEATLQAIFGADGIRVAAILAEKGAAGFDAFAKSMAGTGTAADQAAAKNKGFNFALEAMMGSLDTLKIVLGTAILPLITSFINDALIPGINAVMDFGKSFLNLVPAILASNDPLNTFFNALRISLPQAIPLINAVQSAFDTIVSAIQPIIPVVTAFGQAIISAVSAIPGIISTIGSAAQTLAQPWITAFQSIAPAVQTAIGTVSSIVSSVITTIQGTSTAQLAAIQSTFMTAWSAVATTTGQVLNGLLGIVNPILAAIAAFVATNGADIRNTFVQVWTQVNGIITSSMQLIQATIVPALAAIGSFVAAHGAELQAIFTSVWTIIKTIVTATLSTIQGLITATLAAINGDWTGAWTAIVGVANTQTSAILTVITEFGKLIVAQFALAMDGSYEKMMSYIGPFTSIGKDLIAGVAQGILDGANAVVNATGKVIVDAINAAKSALVSKSPSKRAADEVGLPFSQGVAQGILAGLPEIQTVAAGIGTAMVQSAAGIVAGIKTTTAQAGTAIASGIEAKSDDAKDAGGDLSSGLAKGISDGKSGVISAAIQVAKSAIEAAKGALAIGSPSRKAASEIGAPFVAGIVKGVQDSFGMLQSMAKVLSKNLTDVMKNVALAAVKSFREILTQGLQAEVDLASQDISNIDAVSGLTAGGADATKKAKKDYESALAEQAQADKDYRADQAAAVKDYTEKAAANQADLNALTQDQNDAIAEVMASSDFAASKEEKIAKIKADNADKFAKLRAEQSKLVEEYATRLDDIETQYSAHRIEQAAAVQAAYTEFIRLQNLQIQQQIIAAEAQAKLDAAMARSEETRKTNATAAAQTFALESKQIAEMAKLQADLEKAKSEGDTAEINALMQKIDITTQLQKAQSDLLKQQQAGQTGSPLDDTLKQLTDLQTALQREVQLDKQRAKDTADRTKRAAREAEAAQSQVALDKINALITQVQQGVAVGTGAAITATLDSAMAQVVTQAQQILGIHSPSTVFADKVGKPAGLGVVEGFASTIPQLGQVLSKSVSAMGSMVQPVQTNPTTNNRNYTDASTLNAPMSINTNASAAQIEAIVNRVLDKRTNRAANIKATGGYS